MSHNIAAESKSMVACEPTIGTVGTMTTIEVNCAGFDRVLYSLVLGVATATGLIDMKVQDYILTGGAGAADITGAVLVQVTKALGDTTVQTIDTKVIAARPFQKLVVVTTTAAFPNAVVATLYKGSHKNPPTLVTGTQAVIV